MSTTFRQYISNQGGAASNKAGGEAKQSGTASKQGVKTKRSRTRMMGPSYDLLQKMSRNNATAQQKESDDDEIPPDIVVTNNGKTIYWDAATQTWWPTTLKEFLDESSKKVIEPHLSFEIWKVKMYAKKEVYQYGILKKTSKSYSSFLFRYKQNEKGELVKLEGDDRNLKKRAPKWCTPLEETDKQSFFDDVKRLEVKQYQKTEEQFLKEWNDWPHEIDPAMYEKLKKEQRKRKLPSKTQRDINIERGAHLNGSDTDKKQYKTLEATVNAGIARWSDQTYFFTQFLYRKARLPPPIGYITMNRRPTAADKAAKKRIFDIEKDNQCVVSGMISSGAGDHMFEINGYAKKTGKHGRYDWWNTIPVIGLWNKKYKKIPVMTKTGPEVKDIGLHYLPADHPEYVEITAEQLEECLPEHVRIYNMFVEWKKYCESQGISLFFEFNKADKQWLEARHQMYKTILWDMSYLFNSPDHLLPNGEQIQSLQDLYDLEQ